MAIPLEELRAVRVVVSHRYPDGACPDGLASAMILKDVLPDARYRFYAHNTREYDELAPEPGMLFVDITPPTRPEGRVSRAADFRDAGAIVLDHHKDAEELVGSFGARGVFAHETRDPGVSGALLAFEHVWLPLTNVASSGFGSGAWVAEEPRIRHFAKLAGVRDTWQTTDPLWREACEQAAVLLFYPIDHWLYGSRLGPLDPVRLARRMEIGPHLIAQRERETLALIASAYSFVTEKGTRVTALPSVRISDAAERIGDGADVVVGFAYHVEKNEPSMRLSFRSRGSVDVSAIAHTLGGGGHTRAAGASIRHENFLKLDPYAMIRDLMTRC